MRHRKHNHQLGVKTAHRSSLIANLSCSLIENGRIKTTIAKARALRPFIEKVITLAKKAHGADDAAQKVHFRRLAIARLRNKKAVAKLFDELVQQFENRNGGYTRIYKLALPRLGDAADMALIEFVEEASKKKAKKKKSSKKAAAEKKLDEEKAPSDKEMAKSPEESEKESIDSKDESSSKQPESIKEEGGSENDETEEKSAESENGDTVREDTTEEASEKIDSSGEASDSSKDADAKDEESSESKTKEEN